MTEQQEKTIMRRRERVAELYNAGKTYEKIVAELNVCKTTICKDLQWLRKQGLVGYKCKCSGEDELAERRERVAELYNAGAMCKEIVAALGFSKMTINRDLRWLKEQGLIKKRENHNHFVKGRPAERCERVAELYNEGVMLAEIAARLGLARTTIRKDLQWLREQGIVGKRRAGKEELAGRRERVAELYNEGKTYKEIAAAVGVNKQRIMSDLHFLAKQGIIRRRGRVHSERRKRTAEL